MRPGVRALSSSALGSRERVWGGEWRRCCSEAGTLPLGSHQKAVLLSCHPSPHLCRMGVLWEASPRQHHSPEALGGVPLCEAGSEVRRCWDRL